MSNVVSKEFSGVLGSPRFDDRVDTQTAIGNHEVLTIIARSLKLLATVKELFAAKFFLALFALIPGLIAPWIGKIMIDQVILGKPIDETTVPFPPHVSLLIDYIRGFDPVQTIIAISVFLGAMLVLFGRGGTGVALSYGRDSATQS